jgi:hypothetical protein
VRGAVERDLRANAQLAVIAQVREAWCQAKAGLGGETRRHERLRIVELNIWHQLNQRTANLERLDKLVEIPNRVFKLKIAENIAIRRSLNSCGLPSFHL